MSAKTYIQQLLDAVSLHMDISTTDICKSREESCVSIRYSIVSEMCLTFWLSLAAAFFIAEADIVTALFVSVIASYLSHWFDLVITELNNLYERLWQRQKRKWSQRSRLQRLQK